MFKQGNFNGISYALSETGRSSDRILIFLPGIGAFKESYIEHVSAFSDFYGAIYLVDLPGQGSDGEWRIGVMVEQLAEFIHNIDSPAINRIDLAGHSAGALAIISFLANYNTKAEDLISGTVTGIDAGEALRTLPSLDETGFATLLPDTAKVRKLMMYAPPVSFDTVFDRMYSSGLSNKSEKTVRKLLNSVVNRPMLLLRLFAPRSHFRFRLDKSGKPQYFRLVINDHRRFLKYTSEYLTIFEIFRGISQVEQDQLEKCLNKKEILVQYGTTDWIVKPYRNRHRSYQDNIKISGSVKVFMHKHIGHMLNNRYMPDINMNRQMVTNRDVISRSIEFINK